MLNVEIARLAGVSTATVSRVLRNTPGVSKATIKKVRDVLEERGYQLDVQQRRRRPGFKNRSIAFLVLGEDVLQSYSSTFMRTFDGVESAVSDLGLNLIYAKSSSIQRLPPQVLGGQVDGLILAGYKPREDVVERLAGIPSVWLSSHYEHGHAVVFGGNEHIGKMAVDYLMKRGHRDLAVLNALSGHPALDARREFFEFYAKRSACRSVQSFVSKNDWGGAGKVAFDDFVGELEKLLGQMLSSRPRPTGLFIPVDTEVAIAHGHLCSRGVEIGKDLEIIGCDNEQMALMGLYPKPATIEFDAFSMGKRIVQELVWKIENPEEKSQVVRISIEPKLIPGS